MRRVGLDDLMGLARYATVRDEHRRAIMAKKQDRRVSVGDHVSLVFENFDTVLFQIQEMLHVERITDIDKIRAECDVYNALLPSERELSATLFVEITDAVTIEAELNRLVGIDECVFLTIGDRRARARFDPGRTREDKISAVQYVRFPLSPSDAVDLATPGTPVGVEIDHPSYRAAAALRESQRASLAADLEP
jgi:Protein of unknown function (DUF3501)